jgi:hypothetical protein
VVTSALAAAVLGTRAHHFAGADHGDHRAHSLIGNAVHHHGVQHDGARQAVTAAACAAAFGSADMLIK